MLTFTQRRNLYGNLTGNTSSSNLTLGDQLINETDREIITSRPWDFRERTQTPTTVASQQFYNLAPNYGKLINTTITVGTTKYSPKEITSRKTWDQLNESTSTSNTPEYFFIFNKQIGFYPTPATAGNTITNIYQAVHKDLSVADYITGTITTTSTVGTTTTVTGSGTTWTSAMVGRYIQIATAGGGDNEWYEIATVPTATTLTLTLPYSGTAITAGSATYIIGQSSIIPSDFHILSVYRACELYYSGPGFDADRAATWKNLYREGLIRMQSELGGKSTSPRL